ncbi:MAG TPA: hypothetical protein VGQ39_23630 [Pyrinomonadaceae bacterium]|nr:hypothetical protein [Pyrinomonadaceae bacterium]
MINLSVTQVMAFIASAVGVGVIYATIRVSPNPQNQPEHPAQKFASMNTKARAAKSGDPNAVNALAEDVFNNFGTPETSKVLSVFKDRLVRAEMDYLQKRESGIEEGRMADALNRIAKDLGAPKYAYVNSRQIRYLRSNLLGIVPSFIGQLTDLKAGEVAVNPEMSPLEVVAITQLLVTQKLSNPEFQVPPGEWTKNQHQKRVEERVTRPQNNAAVKSDTELITLTENDKTNALKQLVVTHSSNFLPLIDRYLSDLGISN